MTTKKTDVYDIITERIVAVLESGAAPWRKTWKTGQADTLPANFISRKAYRGINAFLLLCTPYDCPFWLTYKQATEKGGNVRKGEKGMPVVFWNWFPKRVNGKLVMGANGKPEQVPFLRYYTVFNVEQCEGIEWVKPAPNPDAIPFDPLATCEQIVSGMPLAPEIRHGGNAAYYSPSADSVQMPARESFADVPAYYSTLFHELTHATGHTKRLARKDFATEGNAFAAYGSAVYSREELVAEMGAAFLCGHAGILNRTIDNSAAYLAGWIAKMKQEPKLVVTAAAQAQKAADFILAVKHETETEEKAE